MRKRKRYLLKQVILYVVVRKMINVIGLSLSSEIFLCPTCAEEPKCQKKKKNQTLHVTS